MNIKCLQKATFARLVYTESRRFSQLQVAQELLKDYENSSRTVHTDGTSKFGKHYGTYDVVTDQGQTLTAVIREVSSSDIKTQLKVLLAIFSEIEESLQSSEENLMIDQLVLLPTVAATLRLIRTTCKSVQTHGCEKSGRISDFYTYLTEEVGFLNVPFISFRWNWFYVLFYNDGILYYLHDHLQHFFDIVKDDNKLLKAVHSDLQIQSYLCGCRALG